MNRFYAYYSKYHPVRLSENQLRKGLCPRNLRPCHMAVFDIKAHTRRSNSCFHIQTKTIHAQLTYPEFVQLSLQLMCARLNTQTNASFTSKTSAQIEKSQRFNLDF